MSDGKKRKKFEARKFVIKWTPLKFGEDVADKTRIPQYLDAGHQKYLAGRDIVQNPRNPKNLWFKCVAAMFVTFCAFTMLSPQEYKKLARRKKGAPPAVTAPPDGESEGGDADDAVASDVTVESFEIADVEGEETEE